MYIEDFIRRIVDGWRTVLASVVACVVIMGVFLAVYPPQYESSVALKIGMVPPGNPVESVPSVAARMRNGYVLRATLKELNLPTTDRQVNQLRSAIRVSTIDDTTFQMTLRWPDRSQALTIINRLASDMIAQHTAMQAAISHGIADRIRQGLPDVAGALMTPSAGRADLATQGADAGGPAHGPRSLADQTVAALALTLPTVVTFAPDVTDEPVFPKYESMVGLAALIGFAIGVAWTFGSRPRARR